ncbi:phosphotransferase [Frankia sp. AgB1.9]|uniref:phosphotransferase n=1 Tax=unclassified Frankia TaxID=2632575 RepID=UPI001931E1F8|nr:MULTISPECIES: phosphotransferase [unclassified Frankia]MBL7491654.1 phosphotransferase [Frankia sp. AgW1.1]MBL7551627.1 phosphotransferase [Frankia sp. AgB1.9]MBL7624206.1 phosphotransferase [Frankia sp. AgB1.8]
MSTTVDPPPLVSDPRDVTAGWLTDVLAQAGALTDGARVTGFEATAIGTGAVGSTLRYQLRYAEDTGVAGGPATVVAKFASSEEQSRATGVLTLTYEREVAFYQQIAQTVDVSQPRCYYAAIEPGTANVVVVLADLAPAVPGDQLLGCDADDAALAVTEAARLHGPRWGDPTLLEKRWLTARSPVAISEVYRAVWDGFVDRFRASIEPEVITQGEALGAGIEAWQEHRPAQLTVTHGDFRIDNMMFEGAGAQRRVTIVDWQTPKLGAGAGDVAYLIGGSLPVEQRRPRERDLVRRYHQALAQYGVTDGYPFEDCWEDYRRYSWTGLITAVVAGMLVSRTDRGDAMFATLANRHAAHTHDLAATDHLR